MATTEKVLDSDVVEAQCGHLVLVTPLTMYPVEACHACAAEYACGHATYQEDCPDCEGLAREG